MLFSLRAFSPISWASSIATWDSSYNSKSSNVSVMDIVCRYAIESLARLSGFWHVAYSRNPTSPELWEQALPLWDMFGLENGRRNRIVLNALRCITLWNHGQHTVYTSEIISFACFVLRDTLQGPALASTVPDGPPGVPCLVGVDTVVLDVLQQNAVQRFAIMQYTQRMAWKRAKKSAQRILRSLVEANRLSTDNNMSAVLSKLAIDGDCVGLGVMACYCTNVARQREFHAYGPPFWDWIAHMMARDFVSAPNVEARIVLEDFLRFLAAFCRNNREIQCELMQRQVPARLCQVLGVLQNLLDNDAPHDRLRQMKVCIIAVLGTLFACPMPTEQLQHFKQLFDNRLLHYVAVMMATPLQPASSTVTATHCMCILSHLMQSYTSEYSPTLDNMFKNVVMWMDSEPNNKALLVGAFSLLCAIQIDTRNNLINMAIIHAFSGLYKFPSDATILNQCVLFTARAVIRWSRGMFCAAQCSPRSNSSWPVNCLVSN